MIKPFLIECEFDLYDNIKKGVNPLSVNELIFSGKHLSAGIRIGLISGMVALMISKFTENSSSLLFHKHLQNI